MAKTKPFNAQQGSSTATPASNPYSGNGAGKYSIHDALTKTNPNYSTGKTEWTENCQRCVYAYELNRRGMEVEAKPKPANNDPLGNIGWTQVMENQTWQQVGSRSRDKTVRNIEAAMQGFGDGSRAVVYVQWKNNRSAHVFIAEIHNGITVYLDPQKGTTRDIYDTIGASKPTKTMVSRIDNLNPGPFIDETYTRR